MYRGVLNLGGVGIEVPPLFCYTSYIVGAYTFTCTNLLYNVL